MSQRLKDVLHSPPSENFLAVLGSPIDHSLSPLIHGNALNKIQSDWKYIAIQVPEEDVELLPELLNLSQFRGANVTIPLKKQVSEFVDFCDDEVRQTGAANTIYHNESGWGAANTDIHGFLFPLWERESFLSGSKAVVLGTGGAARAVCYALGEHLKMDWIFLVSRKPDQVDPETYPSTRRIEPVDYTRLPSILSDSKLVVNTTPVGMHPKMDKSPIPDEIAPLLKQKICYDLIYRPEKTLFLQQAEKAGGEPIGGLSMFVHQAAKSFQIWTGEPFPSEEAETLIRNTIYESN